MSVLYYFEGMRTPFINALFLIITYCGHEIVTICLFLAILWCMDKKHGYTMLYAGLFGMALNLLLKAWFQVERPWVKDEFFTIVEAARATAGGFSFPSGHTQNATVLYSGLFVYFKNKYAKTVCVLMILLIAFSRMYLGVHTPLDVITAMILGVLQLALVLRIVRLAQKKPAAYYFLDAFTLLFPIAILVWLTGSGQEGDEVNNIWMLLGVASGLLSVRHGDKKFLHYDIAAPFFMQVIKLMVGLGLVFGVLKLGKWVFYPLLDYHPSAACLRYFVATVIGGFVYPKTFSFYRSFGDKICKKRG
ncbi:MAG TPA: hypothetical protein DCY75_06300 [Clostridiales bacterium]|nr:hypothetical protein [Clostridiales bacterium]